MKMDEITLIAGERLLPGDLISIGEDGRAYRVNWKEKIQLPPLAQVETITEENEEIVIEIKKEEL